METFTDLHGGSRRLMELHGDLHGGSWSSMELRGGLHGVPDNVGRRLPAMGALREMFVVVYLTLTDPLQIAVVTR